MLFSSEVVADYAVAARLAALFTFFQLALLKRFAPRAGHLLQSKDASALHREFDLCRQLTIGCGALTISGVLLLAPLLLPLLGNYLDARALLIWLAIPSFVMSFYATSDRLLIIAGQSSVAACGDRLVFHRAGSESFCNSAVARPCGYSCRHDFFGAVR